MKILMGLVLTLVGCVFMYGVFSAAEDIGNHVKAGNAKWDAEHVCMNAEVANGTPRINIVMKDGTCYVKR